MTVMSSYIPPMALGEPYSLSFYANGDIYCLSLDNSSALEAMQVAAYYGSISSNSSFFSLTALTLGSRH